MANGDGSNDVMMMKSANMVIAHHSDDGTFAPGIGALANISEEQLRRLFGSQKSFYELFDINLPKTLFIQSFAPLANSQEKPSIAPALKSGKMTFDLARIVGAEVSEMNQQHWYSVAFDLMWLWISFYEINESSDLPMDNRNINASHLISNTMGIALVVAMFQALGNYALFNESTNLTSMLLMLMFLPIILKGVFSGFKRVQDNLYPPIEIAEIEELEPSEPSTSRSLVSYVGGFFSRKPKKAAVQIEELVPKLE